MDSPLNVYLRSIKLLLHDAEQELRPREFASLRAMLQIKLAWYDSVGERLAAEDAQIAIAEEPDWNGLIAQQPVSDEQPAGRYDHAARRKSQRRGRERGCWVYVPAEELEKTGIDLDSPPPFYRAWGDRRGSVIVRLYEES